VRTRMQTAIDDILKHRKSLFFGAVFSSEAH